MYVSTNRCRTAPLPSLFLGRGPTVLEQTVLDKLRHVRCISCCCSKHVNTCQVNVTPGWCLPTLFDIWKANVLRGKIRHKCSRTVYSRMVGTFPIFRPHAAHMWSSRAAETGVSRKRTHSYKRAIKPTSTNTMNNV